MAFHMLDRPVSSWTQPEVPVFGYTAPQTTAPVIFKPLDGSRTSKPVNVAHTSLENQQQEHRRAVYANTPFCDAAKREPESEVLMLMVRQKRAIGSWWIYQGLTKDSRHCSTIYQT